LLERHLTLDKALPGPDHRASLDPAEFERMVAGVREVEATLGDGVKAPRPSEAPVAAAARKSLHWRRALEAGARVAAGDLVALRPGTGLPPSVLPAVVGRRLTTAVRAGTPVLERELEPIA
jgi:N-acetylneuraminate synthase/N,N'-diacetyllegionaminate synthase